MQKWCLSQQTFAHKTLLRANITCQILSTFQFLKLAAKNFHYRTINTSVFCSLLFLCVYLKSFQVQDANQRKSVDRITVLVFVVILVDFDKFKMWDVFGLSRQVQIMIQLLGRHNFVCSQNTKVGRKLEPPSMKHAISLCVLKTIQGDTLCPTSFFVDISGEQMFINIYFSFQGLSTYILAFRNDITIHYTWSNEVQGPDSWKWTIQNKILDSLTVWFYNFISL